jgi:hypothetical protein
MYERNDRVGTIFFKVKTQRLIVDEFFCRSAEVERKAQRRGTVVGPFGRVAGDVSTTSSRKIVALQFIDTMMAKWHMNKYADVRGSVFFG